MGVPLPKPIEIFYPGSHLSYESRRVDATAAELGKSVDWFNRSGRRIPLVVGHPKNEDKNYGYATKLGVAKNNRVVIAEVEDVDPTFQEIVNSKELSGVSVKIRLPGHPDNRSGVIEFRHVGFFGKSPVALDRLEEASFASPNQEYWIAMEEDFTGKEKDLADREAQFKEREDRLMEREATFRRMEAVLPKIQRWVEKGQLLPRERAGITQLLAQLPESLEVTFAAANGEDVTQSAGDVLTDLLNALPSRVNYKEVSGSKEEEISTASFAALKEYRVDRDRTNDHSRIVAYCKQNQLDPVRDYEQAAIAVLG